jgi:riboflavin-specific deaminase-like protein
MVNATTLPRGIKRRARRARKGADSALPKPPIDNTNECTREERSTSRVGRTAPEVPRPEGAPACYPFEDMSTPTSRPRVLVNFASSIDGKISVAPGLRKGAFTMSRHHEDPRRMRQIRAMADAILIGAGNLRADDPDLAIDAKERMRRREAGEREPLRMVVTDAAEGIRPDQRMFDPALGGPSFILHTEHLSADARERLAPAATLVTLGPRDVDVPRLLRWAAEEQGVRTLLCEGGGVLCAQLFAARAVDQLFLTLVPRILGGALTPTLAQGRGFFANEIPDATLGSMERIGDELYLRYDFSWSR